MDNFNNLGNVIMNPKIRTTIYGTYTVLVVAYLVVDAFLSGAGIATPVWYGGISTALMAASIPVSTLAIANTPHALTHRIQTRIQNRTVRVRERIR